MQEIIQSFFKERSLVNHQIASYDDCIPAGDNMLSRMEKIIRNIRVGIDGEVEDDEGGFIKLDVVDQDIVIRLKNIQLGEPTIREANGLAKSSRNSLLTANQKKEASLIYNCLVYCKENMQKPITELKDIIHQKINHSKYLNLEYIELSLIHI